MKKLSGVTVALTILLHSSMSLAGPSPKGGGGGEHVPSPFSYSNQKVDLADGEHYTLVGYVRIWQGKPYFEVDLKEHPWLATQKRMDFPYYPLSASTRVRWKRYDDERVKVFVKAEGMIVRGYDDSLHYLLLLKPAAEPVFVPLGD